MIPKEVHTESQDLEAELIYFTRAGQPCNADALLTTLEVRPEDRAQT